ncbi:MAG: TMAO reductase system periplasmic protein TorT [Rhodospirillales bacterium]|jgi:periplasmic protein TorT|nr:TMAO reductase system periplasmic protein TorT [Rhodospirillales bacterium]MBT4039219.1 TMAO reductase system periplasmic protein TorT [Rhodospirillales bacterium]MBT4625860.1 TMAO reductase system periplasmic protein TorT [Rhodospirillales bacterium]MBT5350528.1 TMAO reductase system periplasmic protein TorT [Rhodospirillales bacterium]MBT5522205.1 TMAO reductase system periplasmic protein TorT [Rhodospirillales bacterium]
MIKSLHYLISITFGVALLLPLSVPLARANDSPWQLETWQTPYDYQSPSSVIQYAPLEKSSQKWRLCASYPHLKDAYWLSVNYGMVEEAKRLGVSLEVVEAGGYPNMARQISQVKECAKNADILILGTVSFGGLTKTVLEIAKQIPVVAVVNDIADEGISAKTGVSWITMGRVTGEYLARQHPKGSPPVTVAWFPGPTGSGWVPFVEQGFRDALSESSVQVVVTKYGDTGKEIQLLLIEEALEEQPDVDYIVGSAVTAEAAVGLLRARGLTDEIKVLADYFTHAVYRGLKRGRIVAAPTDFPVKQGRLGIEQAVRVLEGKLEIKHVGPAIKLVDTETVDEIGTDGSLAPATFAPTFVVE